MHPWLIRVYLESVPFYTSWTFKFPTYLSYSTPHFLLLCCTSIWNLFPSVQELKRDRDRVCGSGLVCVSVDSRFCLMENVFCLTENIFYFSFIFLKRYFHCSPWCILQCLLSFVFYPAFTASCSRQMVRWCLLLGHDSRHVNCIYVLDLDRVLYFLLF